MFGDERLAKINNPAACYGVLEIAGSDSLPFMISGRIGPI